jgi:hypothetical protein
MIVFEGEVNTKLRSFDYDGKTIYFEEIWDCGEWGEWVETKFYKTNNKWKKIRPFFGLLSERTVSANVQYPFVLQDAITCCHRTKEQNKKYLDHQFELMGRCEEIKKGEIV